MPDSHPPEQDPLDRLSDAVDAMIQRGTGASSESDEDFLARNAGLRDLLEPMLQHSQGEEQAGGSRYLGEYRLLREIGRGGMGVVFEAEESRLGRRVALKVLPPHLTRGPRQIERFRREAAAAARLKHPGIVQIYEVGEVEGTHYFAMELVEGRPLDVVLEELRDENGDFSQGFGEARISAALPGGYMTQVLTCVAQAAEALAAAHEQGVIHRDIKPQNLMLDGGQLRVVDFGLCKDLARQEISQSREVAGTPEYMSPEQVSGLRQLDARSDIYSLGVVLFELLTLDRPFHAEGPTALMQAISTQEPRPPRRLNPRIPRDVEVICRKCLERDPAHRFATAAELAADLRRFLRHEPIEARPQGTATRILKLARRRTAASVAVLLAVLLPALALGAYYGIYLPRLEAVAASERDLEDRRAATARGLREYVEAEMYRTERLLDDPQKAALADEIVQVLVGTFERLLRLEDTPGSRAFLARVRARLGRLWVSLGRLGAAVGMYEKGLADLDAIPRAQRNRESKLARCALQVAMSSSLHEQGRSADARVQLEAAHGVLDAEFRGEVLGLVLLAKSKVALAVLQYYRPEPPSSQRVWIEAAQDCLDKVAEIHRDEHFFEVQTACLLHAARLGYEGGETERAEQDIAAGLEALAVVMQTSPNNRVARMRQAELLRLRALIQEDASRLDDAEESLRVARTSLATLHEGHRESLQLLVHLAKVRRQLAILMARQKRIDEALAELQTALEEFGAQPEPTTPVIYALHAHALLWAAMAQVRMNRRALVDQVLPAATKARGLLAQVERLRPDAWQFEHNHAQLEHNLAAWRFAQRQFAPAEKLVRKALERRVRVLARRPHHPRFERFRQASHQLLIESLLFQRKGLEAAELSLDLGELVPAGKGSLQLASNFARAASLLGPAHARYTELRDAAHLHGSRAVAAGVPRRSLAPRSVFAVMRGHAGWQQLWGGR